MRLADCARGRNRALIDSLANGAPPYTESEAERNKKAINVNDLTLTRISHDARMQLYKAFNTMGDYFRATTDMGASQKRMERSNIVTKEISRVMRRSNDYYECQRSKFALTILHGIGPSTWEDQDKWCPLDVEIADVLIPGGTRLTMRNLPFFAVWRGYTANELHRLTRMARRDPSRNPGWNLPVVDRAIGWADRETAKLYGGGNWSDYWVPEKMVDRLKSDGGIYGGDRAATISCWDFYFWDDAKKREGWRRRVIFDASGGPGAWNGPQSYGEVNQIPGKNLIGDGEKQENKSDFLFSSGNRVVADKWNQILHFQFADLSAKAPFYYHTVRGLGFMLYAICHVQNRSNCSFWEAVFEQLMNYLRVNSGDDAERALKIELIDRGIIDESVHFLRPEERWQPNAELVGLGMSKIRQIINENSSGFIQNRDMSYDRVEKTKFQIMAEVQAMQTMLSSGLQQCYRYQTDEDREIFRRFMKKDSTDPGVLEFRGRCLRRGIPERMLNPEAWDIQPERIMGGGNRTLELAAAQQLMEWRAAYGPQAQQRILKKSTLAVLEDAAETELLVPAEPTISMTRYDTSVAFGSLMMGTVIPKWPESANQLEVTETLIGQLGNSVQAAVKTGGMVSMDKYRGYQNVLVHIGNLMEEIGKDEVIKERVKMLAELSGKIANQIKAFGQRLAEQMKAQGQEGGDGGGEAKKDQAKVAGMIMQAQVKAKNTEESHAQRTAQRQVQSEMESDRAEREFQADQRREDARVQAEIQRDAQRAQVEVAVRAGETAQNLREQVATAAVDRTLTARQAEQDVEIARKKADAKPAKSKEE
jgi:hypothetical protein